MKQYNRFGTFIRVFSSKNTCLRLPDIIFVAYYTCFLVEILGFVLALRSPLQANLKIPCKTRLHAKKPKGPRQVKSENYRVLAIFLALARPIWKYIVMYPFSPLQVNLKIPRKTLALFNAKKKPFPMQIQKLSILHLKSVCFTCFFFFWTQLGSPHHSTNTNPALTTRGIGFIIDPLARRHYKS